MPGGWARRGEPAPSRSSPFARRAPGGQDRGLLSMLAARVRAEPRARDLQRAAVSQLYHCTNFTAGFGRVLMGV